MILFFWPGGLFLQGDVPGGVHKLEGKFQQVVLVVGDAMRKTGGTLN